MMKMTKKTTCMQVSAYIMKKYGNLENSTLAWIWEQFENLATGCGYPENFDRNPTVGEVIDLVKHFQAWEYAYTNKLPEPYYNGDGIFCYSN